MLQPALLRCVGILGMRYVIVQSPCYLIFLSSTRFSRVKGKSVDEVMTIKNSDIAKHLNLPPVKLHCSMLAEDAIKVRSGENVAI